MPWFFRIQGCTAPTTVREVDAIVASEATRCFPFGDGCSLEATSAVRLYLPPAIIKKGEQVADALQLSDDDIEVGFKQAADDPATFTAIIVFLKPQDRIKLCRRSAEVVADADQTTDIVFNVLDSDLS